MNHRDHERAFPDGRSADGDHARSWFVERGHAPREVILSRLVLLRR